MKSSIDQIKLIFLGVFAISCAAIWGYHAFYVWPREACEAHGDWWDWRDRVCAVPMPIWTITGRRVGPEHPLPGLAVATRTAKTVAPVGPAKASAGPAGRP